MYQQTFPGTVGFQGNYLLQEFMYIYVWLKNRNLFYILIVYTIQEGKSEYRRVAVPPHRYTPLKENWMKIFNPIVEHLKLQMRLNLKTRHVELKVLSLLKCCVRVCVCVCVFCVCVFLSVCLSVCLSVHVCGHEK